MESLPDNWADIQPDIIYKTINDQLVSFSKEQIQVGIKYDQNNKHLKAIEKGQVPTRGSIGFVALAKEHLESCNYKVCGYWHENDEFYEEIIFSHSLCTELVSSSIEIADQQRLIKLKFILKADTNTFEDCLNNLSTGKIGDLMLIYNENLEFLDENWQINIDSPFVVAEHSKQN